MKYYQKSGLCAKEYVDREINDSLSGGEIKRIEIATVALRGAKLTIFDEPEAGIDLWSFSNLIKGGKIEQIGQSKEILNKTFAKTECYKMRN